MVGDLRRRPADGSHDRWATTPGMGEGTLGQGGSHSEEGQTMAQRRRRSLVTTHATSALLVIDMQNDFLAQGGYYDAKAQRLQATQGQLRATDLDALARVYRHPPPRCAIREPYQDFVRTVTAVAAQALTTGLTTIFVQAVYEPAACHRPPLFLHTPQRQDYGCHPGSWGADFVEPIKPLTTQAPAQIIVKPTFDAFFATELHGFLCDKQIDTLYVAGVETNVCVLFTVCSALSHGFKTSILVECVTTSQVEVHEPALQIMAIAQGRLMATPDFLARLARW
jgi:ureidoacrylate peracid hydrolase